MGRTLNIINQSLSNIWTRDARARWFISFGSLLSFIRDNGNLDSDWDISMFYGLEASAVERAVCSLGHFALSEKVMDPEGVLPLKMTFTAVDPRMHGHNIDIFFWVETPLYYWHTYNFFQEKTADGRLSQYRFKGIPKEYFACADIRYIWPETKSEGVFPLQYGTVLDYWYPGWKLPMSQFGYDSTSMSRQIVTVQNPVELRDLKSLAVQLGESNEQYEAQVKKIVADAR